MTRADEVDAINLKRREAQAHFARLTMIQQVEEHGLCTGCGTCAMVCHRDAIMMTIHDDAYRPIVDPALCVDCGRCTTVCPIVDQKTMYGLGPVHACHVGYSGNEVVRRAGSSGGGVTQLLVDLIDNGVVDGAVVTRFKVDQPTVAEACIAKTRQEITDAAASKYCPIPVNIALKEVYDKPGRYAVVGLPCHLRGLRKAIDAGMVKADIVMLGLFCHHTPGLGATSKWIRREGANPDDVVGLAYRGDGWPGKSKITLKDGTVVARNFLDTWSAGLGTDDYPMHCRRCVDHLAWCADLCFCDPWLPEYKDDTEGHTIILARTERGTLLLKASKNLVLKSASVDVIVRSQGGIIRRRRGQKQNKNTVM